MTTPAIILSSGFTQADTEFSTSTNATYTPGSSSVSTTPASPAATAATQAAGSLGYLALLCSGYSTSTGSTQTAIAAQIASTYNAIVSEESSFSSQTGSDYTNLVTDIKNVKSQFGSATTITASTVNSTNTANYLNIYEGKNSTISSPVPDILNILNNEAVFNESTSSTTYFAVSMFLLSGNLPGVLNLGLSGDLESILSSRGSDPTNPAESAATWMSEFLSAYVAQSGSSVTGSLLQAILPASGNSATPNYNTFYSLFTGTSPGGYADWTADLPEGLTAANALSGTSFWFSNILPSQGSTTS